MPSAVDALVLCGGAGLRLRSVTGATPKSLAKIGGRPFLEILLGQLQRHGFQRVILAVGYQQEVIRAHLGHGVGGLDLQYSIELSPLGTGGALRNAVDLIESDSVLILNGDSYTNADLAGFAREHRKSGADVSVLVVAADGRVDCGSISIEDGKLGGFAEKPSATCASYINAGIYMATRQILAAVPPGIQTSLESDLFPRWLAQGKDLRVFIHPGVCVDIGTPKRYHSAQRALAKVEGGGSFS